jgi:N-acetylmuramoyl-L-alanine amidase
MENTTSRRTILTAGAGAGALGLLGASAAEAATPNTMLLGSSGASVTRLQNRLNALGYWVGTADGHFGALTQQAVWAVQKAAGQRRSGRADLAVLGVLQRGVRPTPRTRSGNCIEVDLKRQLLMVVNNGALRVILNTSTGSGERYYSRGTWSTAVTPTGTYWIGRRYTAGWETGPLGSMWKPAYWYQGWAIHGSGSIPPYPASHGCCRLSTAGMDMLYAQNYVPTGAKVWVY